MPSPAVVRTVLNSFARSPIRSPKRSPACRATNSLKAFLPFNDALNSITPEKYSNKPEAAKFELGSTTKRAPSLLIASSSNLESSNSSQHNTNPRQAAVDLECKPRRRRMTIGKLRNLPKKAQQILNRLINNESIKNLRIHSSTAVKFTHEARSKSEEFNIPCVRSNPDINLSNLSPLIDDCSRPQLAQSKSVIVRGWRKSETTDSGSPNYTRHLAINAAVSPDKALVTTRVDLISSPHRGRQYKLTRKHLYKAQPHSCDFSETNHSDDTLNDLTDSIFGRRLGSQASPAAIGQSNRRGPELMLQSATPPTVLEEEPPLSPLLSPLPSIIGDQQKLCLPSPSNARPARRKLGMVAQPPIQVSVEKATLLKKEVRKAPILTDQEPPKRKDTSIIGTGGFGHVFRGYYNGKRVAIKQLYRRDAEQESVLSPSQPNTHSNYGLQTSGKKCSNDDSLLREMLAFDLRHPNIVQLLTFTHMSNLVQLVYEYMDGRSLAKMLLVEKHASRLLSFKRITDILSQLSSAIAYCHRRRVLHLDVKPQNVLLSNRHKRGDILCKLADFGCSLQLKSDDIDEFKIHQSTGTLVYSSPELLRHKQASRAADVYSLALTAWQVLSREQLHQGLHAHQIAFLTVSQRLRPDCTSLLERLKRTDCSVPWQKLVDLIEKAWEHERCERPTACEFVHCVQVLVDKYNDERASD